MARTPVIFIPGICGSFNLPVLLDWRAPTLSGWGFPPFIDYGKHFGEAFERAGYTRDRDLFLAFYDWRKAVRDSAATYLRPWIDRARQRSGAKKVILIGHSMGGLVSRSYIQGRDYAGDVERLITLGTPHRGSAESYYAWGAGEPRADPTVQAVFNVYLWYLRHAHPFQTELDPVRTFRTQLPSVRDLLPVDNYLLNQGAPPLAKHEDAMLERNLWGDMLNQQLGLATLFERVPVTTISGTGFSTISAITVGGPPIPPGMPPRFPDGAPVSEQVVADGDGTVLRVNAQLDHPQAKNLPPLPVAHSLLPDHPSVLSQLFGELGVSTPSLGAAPVEETKLVIMTASPVTLEVTPPAGPPLLPAGVLGAGAEEEGPRRRPRRPRTRDHGHAGKHLNVAVVPNPTAGSYNVRLHGTATGSFALGALIISPAGVQVLGGAADSDLVVQPMTTPISTYSGSVAADTDLHFEVICQSSDMMPAIRLDKTATARDAISKLRTALEQSGGGVLGGAAVEPMSVLGQAGGPDELRDPAGAALGGDDAALERVAGLANTDSQTAAVADLLSAVAERSLGGLDEAAAQAIIAQLQALK